MHAISLKSGKALDGPTEPSKRDEDWVKDQDVEIVDKEGDKSEEGSAPSFPQESTKPKPVGLYKPPIPFPQRLAKAKLKAKFKNFGITQESSY